MNRKGCLIKSGKDANESKSYKLTNMIDLYHGSPGKIEGPLTPVLRHSTLDHIHDKPAVFATARIDLASLFMFSFDDVLASIGFEQDIAYICIWGRPEQFQPKDRGGYIYVFSSDNFQKVGKDYEWQSFEPTLPKKIRRHDSIVAGVIDCSAQAYFIDDDKIMDDVVNNKNNRSVILKNLVSENQKISKNIRQFS